MSQVIDKKAKKKKKLEEDLTNSSITKHKVKVQRRENEEVVEIPSSDLTSVTESFDAERGSIVLIRRTKDLPIKRLAQASMLGRTVEVSSREPKLSHISMVKKKPNIMEIKPIRLAFIKLKKADQSFDNTSKLLEVKLKKPLIRSANPRQRKPSTSPSVKPLTHVKPTPFTTASEIRRIAVQPKEIRPQIEIKGSGRSVVRERAQEAAVVSQPAAEGLEKELEALDFIRLVFGEAGKFIAQDKPVCILVKKGAEELHRAIAMICRDLFRERVGGKPTPAWKQNLEKLLEEWHPIVEGKVIVIENLRIVDQDGDEEKFKEMLKCFFSQDYGFLVIVTDNPERLKRCLDALWPSASNQIIVADYHRLAELNRRQPHLLRELLKILSGNKLRIEIIDNLLRDSRLGEAISAAMEYFDDYLIKEYLDPIRALRGYPELAEQWHKVLASRLDLPNEAAECKLASDIHSALKALIWIYEWRKSKGSATIVLEESTKGCDVHVRIGSGYERYYEVETLFGIGHVLGKLMKKMEKYEKCRGRKDMQIVFAFRNIDILRHLQLLYHFRRFWRKRGYQVEIVGFNLDKGEPIAFEEFLKLANSLSSYLSS